MRILVLGGAGMVGHKIWQVLNSRFEDVHVTLHKSRDAYSFTSLYENASRVHDRLDVLDERALLSTLNDVRPDIICNAIGLTWRKDKGLTNERYIRLNALLPHQLNTWCAEHGSKLISFSTDCVFSGETGSYTEESLPDARHMYGRTKTIGEVESPHALILRTSVIGRELEARTELLEWFISQNNKAIKGYRHAYFSGVTTLYLAQTVAHLIEKFPDLNGLFHIASPAISKFDLLDKVRQKFGLNIQIDAEESMVIRKNLVGTKFETATGIRVPDWDKQITDIANDPTLYPSGTFHAK